MIEFVAQVGETVTDCLAYVGALATLVTLASYHAFVAPFQGKNSRWPGAVSQAMAVGVRALPILSLITFFIGLFLALRRPISLGSGIFVVRWTRFICATSPRDLSRA